MDQNDYYYPDIVDGLSDAESFYSSDEEENGESYKQRIGHLGKHLTAEKYKILIQDLDEEDSNQQFEREMANEAQNHVNGLHVNSSESKQQQQQQQEYSAVVCVSKESKSNRNKDNQHNEQRVKLITSNRSNCKTKEQEQEEFDELFYDPEEDDNNQQWIDLKKFHYSDSNTGSIRMNDDNQRQEERQCKLEVSARLKKPSSDATLNCPCCLTLICLDCQRHEIYKTQYRAMFVLNCRVDFSKKFFYKNKNELRKKFQRSKKRKQQNNSNYSNENANQKIDPEEEPKNHSDNNKVTDLYYAVHCNVCNTQVAVYDLDEVYHFFSVIASH